jgi:peptidoglycan/LPS O-acetylase OafA/YrhL
MKKEHYGAIDGLRTIACIGIVLMHVAANNSYSISGFIYDPVIPSFTNFVFLFMTVSAFGMCCGYYERIINNKISFSDFYGKRFKKILPFFGLLVLLDIVMSPSIDALYEAFADLTLLFGFLPGAGNITVIGVGWFLGLIFVFYICFPFFCVLIQSKRRAWMAFVISLIYNFVCTVYFDVGRNNILYSGCFFLAGGLIYLYRQELMKLNRWIGLGVAAVSVVLYYLLRGNTVGCLLISVCWLSYAIICAGGVLYGKVTCWKIELQASSVVSVWRYISHTWLSSELLKN